MYLFKTLYPLHNLDPDQMAFDPARLISLFAVCMKKQVVQAWLPTECKQRSLSAQAGLSLPWAHRSIC